jgi:hypothetical protein
MTKCGFPSRTRVNRGHDVAPREAIDVALYVTAMAEQLETMAVAARLDLLAYFLGMAKAEGDLFVRGNAQADGAAKERGDAGSVDPENHDEMSFD